MKKHIISSIFIVLTPILTGFSALIQYENTSYTHNNIRLSTSPQHAIYMSVSQIAYNPRTKNVELAIKVFIDDMEKAISEANNAIKPNLNTNVESPKSNDLIRD